MAVIFYFHQCCDMVGLVTGKALACKNPTAESCTGPLLGTWKNLVKFQENKLLRKNRK